MSCVFLHSIWKILHLTEFFTRAPPVVLVPNIEYGTRGHRLLVCHVLVQVYCVSWLEIGEMSDPGFEERQSRKRRGGDKSRQLARRADASCGLCIVCINILYMCIYLVNILIRRADASCGLKILHNIL